MTEGMDAGHNRSNCGKHSKSDLVTFQFYALFEDDRLTVPVEVTVLVVDLKAFDIIIRQLVTLPHHRPLKMLSVPVLKMPGGRSLLATGDKARTNMRPLPPGDMLEDAGIRVRTCKLRVA